MCVYMYMYMYVRVCVCVCVSMCVCEYVCVCVCAYSVVCLSLGLGGAGQEIILSPSPLSPLPHPLSVFLLLSLPLTTRTAVHEKYSTHQTQGITRFACDTIHASGFSPEMFVSVVKVYTNVHEARGGGKSVIILYRFSLTSMHIFYMDS